jgi:paired amphipathic helix protein Sin3a
MPPAGGGDPLIVLTPRQRQRISTLKPQPSIEVPAVSPSLVPDLPHPLPPAPGANDNSDQIAFFDRVKKFLSNKQTFNEFLKLCNLFNQDLIDKDTLIHKADGFIGQNSDLMNYFKKFTKYTGTDTVIENRPASSETRVVLSNCRALGPSYRLLPKRERHAICSGRDELCWSVLNDEWASHPTWASEESGFISHRKNVFEENLHRTEEERHDYDFNIETCMKTIQLLEPIVQQINLMSEDERKSYKLPPNLGGQSTAIWQRVIKKLYDRERGAYVIEEMFRKPTKVCPQLLMRLKEKVEKWKQAQVGVPPSPHPAAKRFSTSPD